MLSAMVFLTNMAEPDKGNVFIAFLTFIFCIVGIIALFLGIIKKSANKREWHIFFDMRNQTLEDPGAEKLQKDKKNSTIMIVAGIIMILISHILDYFVYM